MRKSEVTIERISADNVIEKLMEHGIHYLPCSYTNDITELLPSNYTDFNVASRCHSVKVLTTTVGYSLVAMVTDLCCHLTYGSRGAWNTMCAMFLSNYEMLPEIHTIEKCDFVKSEFKFK